MRKYYKLFLLNIFLIMLLTLVCGCNISKTSKGLKFILNDDEKSYAVYADKTELEENVKIPQEYKKLPVTKITDEGFLYCSKLLTIEIPSTITEIGTSAFEGCEKLKELTIPKNVINIKENAFLGCSDLEYVNFEKNSILENIGKYAFFGCSSLTSIEIPTNVKRMGKASLGNCYDLESISIPFVGESLNSNSTYFGYIFGANTYYQNITVMPKKLTKITITGGNVINCEAFYNCTIIKTIELPNTLTNIRHSAFEGCTGLKNVHFKGTESEWNNVIIGPENHCLLNAKITYNC